MGFIQRRAAPLAESITWTGKNDQELVDLAQRVADLNLWPPLQPGMKVASEQAEDGLHVIAEGVTVARVELGNVLVADVFAPTPLFVLSPAEFSTFYETAV